MALEVSPNQDAEQGPKQDHHGFDLRAYVVIDTKHHEYPTIADAPF